MNKICLTSFPIECLNISQIFLLSFGRRMHALLFLVLNRRKQSVLLLSLLYCFHSWENKNFQHASWPMYELFVGMLLQVNTWEMLSFRHLPIMYYVIINISIYSIKTIKKSLFQFCTDCWLQPRKLLATTFMSVAQITIEIVDIKH